MKIDIDCKPKPINQIKMGECFCFFSETIPIPCMRIGLTNGMFSYAYLNDGHTGCVPLDCVTLVQPLNLKVVQNCER